MNKKAQINERVKPERQYRQNKDDPLTTVPFWPPSSLRQVFAIADGKRKGPEPQKNLTYFHGFNGFFTENA